MLGSISSFHSVTQGSYSPQYSFEKNNHHDSLKNNEVVSDKTEANQKIAENQTKEEQTSVEKLKSRDREVRAHEQAHLGAAGAYATGGASFSYTSGPDGARYAIGGEVGIDTSSVSGDPAATIRKADVIRRAALAPASPSSQDQMVASKANAMAEKARAELMQKTQEENKPVDTKYKTDANFETVTGTIIDFSV